MADDPPIIGDGLLQRRRRALTVMLALILSVLSVVALLNDAVRSGSAFTELQQNAVVWARTIIGKVISPPSFLPFLHVHDPLSPWHPKALNPQPLKP